MKLHFWPNEKQELLLKAVFGQSELAANCLREWHEKFSLSDLDASTRAILPFVIQSFPMFKIEPNIFKRYQQYYQMTWLENSLKFNKLFEIINLLTQQNIKICLLKGAAMLLYFYKNMGMRPGMNDIDILIKEEDLPKAIDILKGFGFSPEDFFEYKGEELEKKIKAEGFTTQGLHAITYRHENLEIDLHWKLMSLVKESTFDHLFSEMNEVTLFNNKVYVLSAEAQLFHSCIHGMNQMSEDGKCWWVIDALYLIKQHNINWNKIFLLSQQYRLVGFIKDFIYYIKTIDSSMVLKEEVNCFLSRKPDFFQRIFYRMQISRIPLVRKISFYSRIYLNCGAFGGFPKFIRGYFGISGSLFQFMFKKVWKNI